MTMDFNLSLNLEQKLVMTQQMQLSVKLLQMSTFDLQEYVEKELQENPVLDSDYEKENKDKSKDNEINYKELIKNRSFDSYKSSNYESNGEEKESPLNFIAKQKSLKEYLMIEISDCEIKNDVKAICNYIVENLDSKGYLDNTVMDLAKELNVSPERIEHALSVVQSLDPSGIGARDLKECLKIQLIKKNISSPKLFILIDEYLEELSENKYSVISKKMGIDIKKAQAYGDLIKTLEPKPSRGFYTGEEIKYITPDAYIKKNGDEYIIIMNEDVIPRLTINNIYKQIITNENDKDAVEYVKDKINSAMFLIKSIEHRKSTIYRVIEKVVQNQKAYFDKGRDYLKPMILKDIADEINMHESTVSRAIKDKYIYTNNGTIRIKDLFTTGLASFDDKEDVSVNIIKKEIKDLINLEDTFKPLSDQAICNILNDMGRNICRRTVAKYREELNLKSSTKRRRF